MGGTGAGQGSTFCNASYCYEPGFAADRANLPVCLQTVSALGPACVGNPTLCLPQNGDTSSGAAAVTVLPQSVHAPTVASTAQGRALQAESVRAVGNAATGPSAANASAGGISVASVSSSSAATALGGAREGLMSAQSVVRSSAASGAFPSQTVRGRATASADLSVSSVSSGASALAGAQRESNLAGPAPDVVGPYGPSLFSTSTRVIRQRCQAGKLNNCP